MRYISVCAGIEAATQAWHPLGWEPVAFSEIDPFPCEVLHQRLGAGRPMFMPDPAEAETVKDRKARAAAIKAVRRIPEVGAVPNFGDMTQFERWPDAAVDVLVGGTPCQDYSVAGLRLGMAGSRGQLTLTYVEIAARYRPRWLVWENVPGVLSSNGGRDFARFLGEISGQSVAVPEGGWSNAGIVSGIPDAYGLAYRVLDAQFVRTRRRPRAVPQRRRRVFVVGYLGDWRRAAAVLFDRESLLGNPSPGRKSGENPAPTISARPTGGGGLGTDFDLDGGLIPQGFGGGNTSGPIDAAACLTAKGQRIDFEVETFVAHALRGEGFDASEDGTGRGTPIVLAPHPIAIQERAVSENPEAGPQGKGWQEGCAYTLEARNKVQAVAFDLRGREDGSMPEGPHDTANIRAASGGSSRSYVAQPWAVRRLTPRECERLQGFPDDFLLIPVGNRLAADGPRYKALGNSMAVNVMEWLGQRIAMVSALDMEATS